MERINCRNNQNLKIKTAWQARVEHEEKIKTKYENNNQTSTKSNDDNNPYK